MNRRSGFLTVNQKYIVFDINEAEKVYRFTHFVARHVPELIYCIIRILIGNIESLVIVCIRFSDRSVWGLKWQFHGMKTVAVTIEVAHMCM